MDADILARVQFGLSIACHILFPTITIGLAWFLVLAALRARHDTSGAWSALYRLWARIFALSFAVGIATGLIQGLQLVSSFGAFYQIAAPVLGRLRWAEGWAPLLIELAAIAIMLRADAPRWQRWRLIAALFIALCLTNAAFWILCANSWMQTPRGVVWRHQQLVPVDWLAVIFTPSFPYRLAHMLTASLLSTALVVAAVSASLWRHGQTTAAGTGLRIAVLALAVPATLQIGIGHLSGRMLVDRQPAKFAAMEGLWHGGADLPLVLLAWPDRTTGENRYALELPHLGSLLATHSWHGQVQGLDALPIDRRPPVAPVFYAFRLMVAAGMIILGLGSVGAWLLWRGRLRHNEHYLRLLIGAWPLGFVATISGWLVTELGRQPWTVTGLLLTSQALSPALNPHAMRESLCLLIGTYSLMLGGYAFLVLRLIKREITPAADTPRSTWRPWLGTRWHPSIGLENGD